MEYQFWVYIMASESGTLYIGVTNDLAGRVDQHKLGLIPGFTKTYKCNRLVYFEVYGDVEQAIAREKQIKRWGRAKKLVLINKLNPRWEDLSRNWGRELVIAQGLMVRRAGEN